MTDRLSCDPLLGIAYEQGDDPLARTETSSSFDREPERPLVAINRSDRGLGITLEAPDYGRLDPSLFAFGDAALAALNDDFKSNISN